MVVHARFERPEPIEVRLEAVRAAQRKWTAAPLRRRLAWVRHLRHALAEDPRGLAGHVSPPQRRGPAETLTAEVLPLADACRFIERRGEAILRTRRPRNADRPPWLWGVEAEVRREPWGVVLVLGPSNYPLFLPAVQAVQALAAGNAVLWKPGRGGRRVAARFQQLARAAGLPRCLLEVLPEGVEWALASIAVGVDKVVATGSTATGRDVLRRLSDDVTPATVELSGCDAVFVRPEADLELVADAVTFGLTFNGGATCIAPRRIFVDHDDAPRLATALRARLAQEDPVRLPAEEAVRLATALAEAGDEGATIACGGGVRNRDVAPTLVTGVTASMRLARQAFMAPIASLLAVDGMEEALTLYGHCPHRLGATVFGEPGPSRRLAERIDAGVVVVNDMIVPTADPRVPFGGRGTAGYGSTRGAEGLLEMTRPKTVLERRGRRLPHLRRRGGDDSDVFDALIRTLHAGSWGARGRGARDLLAALWRHTRGTDRHLGGTPS